MDRRKHLTQRLERLSLRYQQAVAQLSTVPYPFCCLCEEPCRCVERSTEPSEQLVKTYLRMEDEVIGLELEMASVEERLASIPTSL